MSPLIIKNAELRPGERRDVLIARGHVNTIAENLPADPGMQTIDAQGGTLLPGLNDHHLHLASFAVARNSLFCGPPVIENAEALSDVLRDRSKACAPDKWLRGTGYHESVAGDIDAQWLDARISNCPVRIQHRGGRLWIFNSLALKMLSPKAGDPFERKAGRLTGRLIEGDAFLRTRLASEFPDLTAVSAELASYGITGVTDTTPQNNLRSVEHFSNAHSCGQLRQSLLMMGDASLDLLPSGQNLSADLKIGAHKFHLLESRLPDFAEICAAISRSHETGRNVAFHCVTRTEIVFALAALRAVGVLAGDRIEHASIAPPEIVEQLQSLGLIVVTQPAFVLERGEQYLRDVAAQDQAWLYRLQGLLEAGIALAASSDAAFATANPWLGMHAAVTRRTQGGAILGASEALTPEQALALYTSPLATPGSSRTALKVGDVADLCLLPISWASARQDLSVVAVRNTLKNGEIIYSSPSG